MAPVPAGGEVLLRMVSTRDLEAELAEHTRGVKHGCETRTLITECSFARRLSDPWMQRARSPMVTIR